MPQTDTIPRPAAPATLRQAAGQAHAEGRLTDAAALYEACLAADPGDAEAWHGQGWLRLQQGEASPALRCFANALRHRPWEPELWLSQLEALFRLGQYEAVHQVLHRARARGLDAARAEVFAARLSEQRLQVLTAAVKASGKTPAEKTIQPPEAEMLALRRNFLDGRYPEALRKTRHLLKRYPLSPFGWRVLGLLLPLDGDLAEAMQARRIACDLDPEGVDAAMNLALALTELHRLDEAEPIFARVLERQPEHPRALVNYALLLSTRGDPQAEDLLRRARAAHPQEARVAQALGCYLRDRSRPSEAKPLLTEVLAEQPDNAAAAIALAACHLALCEHDQARHWFRRVEASALDDPQTLSNALFVCSHLADVPENERYRLHRRYGERLEAACTPFSGHPNPRDPERRLRIGFVSGDLRRHPVAQFLLPVWEHLDRERFELFAYANHDHHDEVSQRLERGASGWRSIIGQRDDTVADGIRRDGIDLLIDLSGHTAFHRLGVFALKPAPLQLSWLGYPGTTGLSRIDYYLADTAYVAHGPLDAQFSECLLLTEAGCGFDPGLALPPVQPAPCIGAADFTFGSFNRANKLTPETFGLWAAVLAAVPEGRLCVGGVDAEEGARVLAALQALGVAPERIRLLPRMPLPQYLEAHAAIDLLLDSIPYGGGTTTCYGLWMGVPTLTLAGASLASRSGQSGAARVGLPDFVADSPTGFVAIARRWARDREGLAAVRSTLRERLANSALGNPALAAAAFGTAMRQVWRRWCQGLPPERAVVPRPDRAQGTPP